MSIRVEVSEPSLVAPQLLSFPTGVPLVADSDAADPLLSVYRKGSGRKVKGAVVFASSAVSYKGCDFAERGNEARSDSCRYAIGVYCEGDDVLKLVPAPHAYVMRPEFEGMKNHPKAPVRLSSMTAQERRESRTEEFASSKKKRAVKASQSNSILSENISGASALESVLNRHYEAVDLARDEASDELQDGGDAALERQRRENLPPYNLQATEAEDIYPFEQMLPPSVLSAIERHYDSVASSADEGGGGSVGGEQGGEAEQSARALRAWLQRLRQQQAPELALEVLSERLRSVQKAAGGEKRLKSGNRPEAVRLLAVKVLLLCWGVKYLRMVRSGRDMTVRKDELLVALGAPPEAVQLLGERYGHFRRVQGQGSFQATKEQMNKLVLLLIVLGLSVSKFRLSLTQLGSALQMPQNGLAVYAREAGCAIGKDGTELSASLEAPLNFPKRKRPRG